MSGESPIQVVHFSDIHVDRKFLRLVPRSVVNPPKSSMKPEPVTIAQNPFVAGRTHPAMPLETIVILLVLMGIPTAMRR
jgi:hypothetical protein